MPVSERTQCACRARQFTALLHGGFARRAARAAFSGGALPGNAARVRGTLKTGICCLGNISRGSRLQWWCLKLRCNRQRGLDFRRGKYGARYRRLLAKCNAGQQHRNRCGNHGTKPFHHVMCCGHDAGSAWNRSKVRETGVAAKWRAAERIKLAARTYEIARFASKVRCRAACRRSCFLERNYR